MHPFPETPSLPDDPTLTGHLWVQEIVTGLPLGFRVEPSGYLRFGDGDRYFDDVPLPYLSATEHVREELDRDALREATDGSSVTFYGTATVYDGVAYDWKALPPFLGTDIRSGSKDGFLTPDAASRAYGSLGLSPLPAVEKEASADYTDLHRYVEEPPASEWRDGDVAGLLFRDKSGGRYEKWVDEGTRIETVDSVEDAVEAYATDDRIDDAASGMDDATVDAVLERLLADAVREGYARLYDGGEPVVSERELRSAFAERVQRRLG